MDKIKSSIYIAIFLIFSISYELISSIVSKYKLGIIIGSILLILDIILLIYYTIKLHNKKQKIKNY
ncbi:hypothetical protein [Acidiplasma sp.]|uniref:hypothetical protein n=1 Tax=Acidiplasma sp. TaxID=1872114 RepID=UPI002585005D|nr:hypothetical protein [Acidiplasma sp.]